MQRKLTISVSEDVYKTLYSKVGAGKISRFFDRLARTHLLSAEFDDAYAAMAADEAREREAEEWVENLTPESVDETR
jgi:predicted CopG family antitoxin